MTGFLYMIIGPMCAGKSSKLLRLIKIFKNKNTVMEVYKHNIDTRYNAISEICSHNMIREPCVAIADINDIFNNPNYEKLQVIIIEEAQFFTDDIVPSVQKMIDDGKYVIVGGLSGDSNMKPFGQINNLISIADKTDILTAYCDYCVDCVDAPFTIKLGGTQEVVEVGIDMYKPVCRKHYNELSKNN